MSNRIQIKHGQNAPGASDLEPFELGYASSNGKLYIGVSEGSPILLNPEVKLPNPSLNDFDITVTADEINKLDGIGQETVAKQLKTINESVSSVANQLNTINVNVSSKVPQTRKINELSLDKDITLTPKIIGAQPAGNYQPAGDYVETKILYNNANGTTGTVDLLESAANFSLLEIIVGYADKIICGNAKIVSPNSKIVDISASTIGDTKYIGMSRTRCTISEYTITQSNNYKAAFQGRDDGTVTWALANNNLHIYSVIGYR